jgi:hypothetical protein
MTEQQTLPKRDHFNVDARINAIFHSNGFLVGDDNGQEPFEAAAGEIVSIVRNVDHTGRNKQVIGSIVIEGNDLLYTVDGRLLSPLVEQLVEQVATAFEVKPQLVLFESRESSIFTTTKPSFVQRLIVDPIAEPYEYVGFGD